MTTPPLEIDYDDVIAAITALAPWIEPARVSSVRIDPTWVTVDWWDGRHQQTHMIRIAHKQGSATEGGTP